MYGYERIRNDNTYSSGPKIDYKEEGAFFQSYGKFFPNFLAEVAFRIK